MNPSSNPEPGGPIPAAVGGTNVSQRPHTVDCWRGTLVTGAVAGTLRALLGQNQILLHTVSVGCL